MRFSILRNRWGLPASATRELAIGRHGLSQPLRREASICRDSEFRKMLFRIRRE